MSPLISFVVTLSAGLSACLLKRTAAWLISEGLCRRSCDAVVAGGTALQVPQLPLFSSDVHRASSRTHQPARPLHPLLRTVLTSIALTLAGRPGARLAGALNIRVAGRGGRDGWPRSWIRSAGWNYGVFVAWSSPEP